MWMVLQPRNLPIPSRHHSNLASVEWFPVTGHDWKSCGSSWSLETKAGVCKYKSTSRFVWSREKRRQAGRRESTEIEEGPSPQTRPASRQSSHFEGLSLPFSFHSASFKATFPSVLFGSFPARAPFCCTCCAEVSVYKEVRRLLRFPCMHLSLVELETSMLGYTPFFVTFLVVSMKPQQSPASAIWPHISKGGGFGQTAETHFLWICAVFNLARKEIRGR